MQRPPIKIGVMGSASASISAEDLHQWQPCSEGRIVEDTQVEQLFQIMNTWRRATLRNEICLKILLHTLLTVVTDDIRQRCCATTVQCHGALVIRLGFVDPFSK